MTGHWVLTGTIGKAQTTHDVDVDWVLNRQYIRIHEVSREKDAGGGPAYEAWIYLVWDAASAPRSPSIARRMRGRGRSTT